MVLKIFHLTLGPFVFLNGTIINLEVRIDDLDCYYFFLVIRVGVIKCLGTYYAIHGCDDAGLN